MDVGRGEHRDELERRMLLLRRGGVCGRAARRRTGSQPGPHPRDRSPLRMVHAGVVRDLGGTRDHLRAGTRQRRSRPLFRRHREPGERWLFLQDWAHCVINADPEHRMVFGAWCDRQYGFVYDEVRAHGGLAWFPVLDCGAEIRWEANPRYLPSDLIRAPRAYPELGLIRILPCTSSSRAIPKACSGFRSPHASPKSGRRSKCKFGDRTVFNESVRESERCSSFSSELPWSPGKSRRPG